MITNVSLQLFVKFDILFIDDIVRFIWMDHVDIFGGSEVFFLLSVTILVLLYDDLKWRKLLMWLQGRTHSSLLSMSNLKMDCGVDTLTRPKWIILLAINLH